MANQDRRARSRRHEVKPRQFQFEKLEPRVVLSAQPIISEFLASNDDGLLDDNGNSTDWIEIYNAGDMAVDLAGYTLTDDPNDIDKWAFPSVTLLPNRHLVVFAGVDEDPGSGNDLYTGFSLSSAGEYVGLYDPLGSVLSEFGTGGTDYPAQREDVSYGLESIESLSTALAEGATSQYLVPNATTGPLVGDLWRQPDYALGTYGETWLPGASGFGYERTAGYDAFIATDLEAQMYNQSASAYIRSSFQQDANDPIDALSLNARYDDGFIAYLNGIEVLRRNGPAVAGANTSIIPLDNLFDDPSGTALSAAIESDTYQAEAEETDLGVHTIELGTLNQNLAIAPNVVFNLTNVGGGSGQSGPISNDTFRAQSTDAIRTLGLSNPPQEKVEDGIGIHSNGLITFDINELRTAGGFTGQAGYFTTRSGINDSAGTSGNLNTIAILSNSTGQVIAGYVNGQLVEVSNLGGVWSFSGATPGNLQGSGDNRFAPIAMSVPADAAYLTLGITGNGARNSDHGVFSNPQLEFQSVALSNLFDDAKGTSLNAAMSTDTFQARGESTDLGVELTVDGGFQTAKTIAPMVSFDFSNVGDSSSGDGVGPGNDTWSSDVDRPIRTRNIELSVASGTKIEDGIGMVGDELITFDVEELRTAGGFANDLEFRFRARTGINDEALESASGLAIVLASDSIGNVVGGWVNGQATSVIENAGTWSLDFPDGLPAELTAANGAINLDIALPSNTAYLTLVSAGGETTSDDERIVFAGARLTAVQDADGVNWQSVAGASHGDSEAVVLEEFDLSNFTGLLRDGENILAIHALNRSTTSSDFLFSHEIVTGTRSYVTGGRPFLTEPTPGTFNGPGVVGFVEDVQYSVDRGFHDAPINVALTTTTPSAAIYYTTDFSLPGPDNPNATLYSGAVNIGETTTLRAAAYRTDYAPSYTDTQTYVFVEDVIVQDPRNDYGNGVSPNNGLVYPETWDSGVDGDYGLDPDVVAQWDDINPSNTDFGIRESLQSLPTFYLTMEHGDAWRPLSDPFPGILTDARNRGEGFRHEASIEYFDPATGDQFQANAAVQAQGNSSRGSGSTRQHSYRLVFNETLGGPGKLNFPLFDNSDFADINTFTLKVASTDGFSHDSRTNGSTINPLNSTYTRDAFIRQLHFDTNNPAADHTFAHVYINGLYWGLYIPIERPDDAWWSDRFGGEREDWDVFRDNDEFISGNSTAWNQMRGLISSIGSASDSQADDLFQQLQGKNSDGTLNPNLEPLMDVDNFIDYMAIHMSNNVNDWPHRNWYVGRNRVNPGKGFQFIAWDQGQSLAQDFIDRTERQGGLGTLHRQLRNSPEYRLRFADRIQKHFYNDGALTLEAKQQTWSDLNDTVGAAIVAETARWGDSREGEFSNAFGTSNPPAGAPTHPLYPPGFATTVPTLTIDNWRTNVNFVHDEVLPFGRPLFFQRMLADGLMSSQAAPSFEINGSAQHGGIIVSGDDLTISASGNTFYTLDGTDPRTPGGSLNGMFYSGPIDLTSTTVVKARTFVGNTWSALTEATFTVEDDLLVISEINHHPHDPTTSELAIDPNLDADDFDFIEVLNTSATTSINLNGMQLADAVSFTFGNVVLGPRERAIVVEDSDAFEARYGTGLNVVGQWSGALSNNSENIVVLNSVGSEVFSVEYGDSDPWSVAADGAGATLVLEDPTQTPSGERDKYYRWHSSVEFGGTPDAGESSSVDEDRIVINEVLAHTDLPEIDFIELYNPTGSSIDIGGWFLSDAGGTLQKFEIPGGTILGAGEYITFDEDDFNPTPATPGANDFALNADGDEVYLTRPDGLGGVLFVDAIDFGASFNGESFGRVPDGSGRLAPLTATTPESSNSAPRIAEVVISEVNYHPANPTAAAQSAFQAIAGQGETLIDNDLEFVEIHNSSASTVNLTNWRLRGESDYDFAASATLASGATLVVVTFDPATDAARLAGFVEHYGLAGAGVTIVGGLNSNFNNGFGRVTLQQPDIGPPTTYVIADEVLYDDLAPWPTSVDGGGESLQRISPNGYGNDSASWLGSVPTPGVVDFPATDFEGDGDVDGADFLAWQRGFGTTYNSTDLANWQSAYPSNSAFATVSTSTDEVRQFTPLAFPQGPTQDAQLADAAIALVNASESESDSTGNLQATQTFTPAEQQMLAATSAAFSQASTAIPEGNTIDDSAESIDEPLNWLSDELLERVFG